MTPTANSFVATPLLLSKAWMDLWLLPLRMTQAMFAVGAGMNRDLTSDAMAAAEDIENRTTDVLEAAEEKISQMDEMPDRVIADPGALVR